MMVVSRGLRRSLAAVAATTTTITTTAAESAVTAVEVVSVNGDDAVLWQAGFLLPDWVVVSDSWPVCCPDRWNQRSDDRRPVPGTSGPTLLDPLTSKLSRLAKHARHAHTLSTRSVTCVTWHLLVARLLNIPPLYRQGHHPWKDLHFLRASGTSITSLSDRLTQKYTVYVRRVSVVSTTKQMEQQHFSKSYNPRNFYGDSHVHVYLVPTHPQLLTKRDHFDWVSAAS